MVNYYFDTFEHLKSFDVVPYQDIIDLYLTNQSLLTYQFIDAFPLNINAIPLTYEGS